MASATSKPQKKLAEFLEEQQEPFVLEVYLLERGYSNSSKSLVRSASSALNKKRKALFPFSRVLTSVCKKLASHNKSTASTTTDSHKRDEGIVSVPETERVDQIVVETDRFSSASSSTVFNSCSEIDDIEEETWISSHQHQPSFTSDTCQSSNARDIAVEATTFGKHCRRFIEDSPALLGKVSPWGVRVSQNSGGVTEDVGRMEQRILSCGGVVMPKKITEDSLLSAALWGLHIQSAKRDGYSMELREILGPNVSQTLKSKRALHISKQLLFDCVRETAVTCPRKDDGHEGYKQLLGAEELGKFICDKTREWGQLAGDQTNLTCLLTLDYMNSVNEWSDLKPHRKDISFEIADAILERINNEIVSEMIEIFTPTI